MFTQPRPFLTPERYLEIDRAAERRSEYHDGEVFVVSAATRNHGRIQRDLLVILDTQLRGGSCEALSSTMRVQIRSKGPYFYPDIVVLCGKSKLADSWGDMVTDATVVIEILSPSTEDYDRGFKFEHYRRLPSLKDYLVIAQDRIYLEHHTPQVDGSWRLQEISDRTARIELPSIGCAFRVQDIYEHVEFADDAVPE